MEDIGLNNWQSYLSDKGNLEHYKISYIPRWKRLFDIILSLIFLTISFPLFIIIALLIKVIDGGEIFYTQERVGYRGKRFKIIKFRTMYKDAEKRLQKLLQQNPELRKEWERNFKLKNDPRITPIGKFLRRTSLDELPQFINVLKGDMSIVGPRPVVKEELEKFYKDKAVYYLSVRPGITGYWQVNGRSSISSYQERVNMDVWYVKNQSLFLDIKIILKTIKVVFTGEGAY